MGDLRIKRVCGFNISSIHFLIMILPYINKELKEDKNVLTILEDNLEKNIKQVLSKIILNNNTQEAILQLNWKSTDTKKIIIEKMIKTKLAEEKDLNVVIYGSEKYINQINEIINENINNKINKKNKNIKIIDCYSVNDFKENIREILDSHDAIFNTSGEHKKEEVFEDYRLA